MGARLKFWQRSRVPKKGSRDEAVNISRGLACENIPFSSLFAVGDVSARNVPSGEERGETDVFAGYSPPSNLTLLYYNGSAVKSHSTTTQYRQLRRLV